VAMKECPDLDPGQAFGGYVEGLADAAGGGIGGGGVEEETGSVAAVVPYVQRGGVIGGIRRKWKRGCFFCEV
jgi:hypothetical protein